MLTIREILSIGRLQESEILAGEKGLNRVVEGVTIMDIPQIADWLTGGELVIAGVLFEQCFSKELVDAFLAKRIAGLVTKRKFIHTVAPEVLEYCNQTNFPILLAPGDCNWGQIMNPITSYMVSRPYLIIEESLKFHDALMKATIRGLSLSDICTHLYEATGLSSAVMDPDLYLIGFSKEFDWKGYTRDLSPTQLQYAGLSFQSLDEGQAYIYTFSNLLLRSTGKKLLFYPVFFNHVNYGYIAIAADYTATEFQALDLAKIQQMALFVALYSTKTNEISNATRRFNGLLMDRLLSDSHLTQQQAETLLAPLGKKLHRTYYAVQLVYDELSSVGSFVERNYKIGQFHAMLDKQREFSRHILSFEKADALILLVPHPIENFDTLLLEFRDMFLTATGMEKIYIGVSDPLALAEVKTAFMQSEHAANYLRSTKSGKPYFHYHDLGVLKFFMDHQGRLNETYLKSIYERYITPLVKYDAQHQTQLMETLELYIGNNCSKVETGRQLFIHKNTLRARLDTIGKILDCNMGSTEDLFNIQMALKLKVFFD